jgi:hypothetical protein
LQKPAPPRPGASSKSAPLLATVLALVLATHFSACGDGSSPASPTPTPLSAGISASLTPSSPTVRRMSTTDPTRSIFELRGAVTFRDAGFGGLQLTALEIEIVDAAGNSERQTAPINVTVPPGGTATHPLPDSFTLPAGREPLRVRIRAMGRDADGRMRTTDVVEAAVVFVASGTAGFGGDVTFVGAGDIADCAHPGAQATARLLDTIPGEVFTLGDNVYPSGTAELFSSCYHTTWGRHIGRTRPIPGNHDWGELNALPYFDYFGAAAGTRLGYYSFNLGAWHVLALNSNAPAGTVSAQFGWVAADLAANPSRCTLAMWHHARFSSGPNGNSPEMQQIWWLLEQNGVDLVLSAHEHMYERFARQDNEGNPRPNGMRQIVAGTGGAPLAGPQVIRPNSEVRGAAWGVLKMTLRSDNYSWQFIPAPGSTFTDSGTDTCR